MWPRRRIYPVLQTEKDSASTTSIETIAGALSRSRLKLLMRSINFTVVPPHCNEYCDFPKTNKQVESLDGLLHNPLAFTSPVDEVVAWGEDTWP
jgi:hypothetical protein